MSIYHKLIRKSDGKVLGYPNYSPCIAWLKIKPTIKDNHLIAYSVNMALPKKKEDSVTSPEECYVYSYAASDYDGRYAAFRYGNLSQKDIQTYLDWLKTTTIGKAVLPPDISANNIYCRLDLQYSYAWNQIACSFVRDLWEYASYIKTIVKNLESVKELTPDQQLITLTSFAQRGTGHHVWDHNSIPFGIGKKKRFLKDWLKWAEYTEEECVSRYLNDIFDAQKCKSVIISPRYYGGNSRDINTLPKVKNRVMGIVEKKVKVK